MMIASLVVSAVVLLIGWMWLQLAKREVSRPIWSALEIPELAEDESPFVSILVVPHRGGWGIERCVQSLLRQDYPHYEVVIADERSNDGPWERWPAIKAPVGDAPLRIIQMDRALAETSRHAFMRLGVDHARGEWLLFTTPETYHAPGLLSRAMAYTRLQGLGVLSLAARHECRTFWEHVCHPIALQYLDLVMPMGRVSEPHARGVWASDAFVLMSREVLTKAGGHEAVASESHPAGALMRRAKALGYRVEFVKAMDLLQARPYRTFRELWAGWGADLYRLFGARPWRVIAHAVALWMWTVLPFAALIPAFSFGFWGLDAVHGWWDVVLAVSAILAVVTILQSQSVLRRVHRQNHFYTATLPLGGLCLGAAALWRLTRRLPGEGPTVEGFSLSAAKEVGSHQRGCT
jgi:chlorobactene glucosyltransferase